MRIPLYKVYRAFPELDHLSDEQCERLITRVKVRPGVQMLWGCLYVLVFLLAMVLMWVALIGITASLAGFNEFAKQHDVLFALTLLLLVIGVPTAVSMLLRDFVYRRQLARAIEYEVDRVRCLACRYILIGQVAYDGRLDCPECGSTFSLKQLGITEGDLLPPGETNPDTVGTVSAG